MAVKNWNDFVVGQFIGGQAFFFGMALCLLGASLKTFFSKAGIHTWARLTVLVGVVLVTLSAAPFPFWVYGLFFVLLALAAFRRANWVWRGKNTGCVLLLLLWAQSLLMVRTEIRYSLPPKIPFGTGDTLYVVGDSLSMGADPPGKNWPELLGDLARLKVRKSNIQHPTPNGLNLGEN